MLSAIMQIAWQIDIVMRDKVQMDLEPTLVYKEH